mmetsp:Transcript_19099/g.18228  ORF Transcript_19099/g.18228 Transcript_19099/m.18228 type:complete len:109 (+) Transcript_19099:477-803(+)
MYPLVFCTVSMLPFYYATLEQYYTGELVMPMINGVDEGSIVYFIVCLVCAKYGCRPLFCYEVSLLGYENVQVMEIVGIGCNIFIIYCTLDNLKNIYSRRNTPHFKSVY